MDLFPPPKAQTFNTSAEIWGQYTWSISHLAVHAERCCIQKKRTSNISANSSIHVHMQGYIKHETTLLHQTKGLSGLRSGLSVCPKWMPRKISKTRPSMNDISLTYSTYLLLLNIQGLPESDIFPILIGLDDISDLRLFHWALLISRTFSIYDILCRGVLEATYM